MSVETSAEKEQQSIDPVFIEQAQSLCRGGELLPGGAEELAKKLQWSAKTQTPLRVKLGLDPTRPDLHLGHSVVLKKLRAFQDLGHQAVLIIGDATAMIGDPSGRSATRPPLTEEEVKVNAQTYLDQAGQIINVSKAEIVRNSEWLSGLQLGDFLKLAAKVTLAQILVREDFATRYNDQKPISLHELFYPLMQGYDSVMVNADIELGGTDQRFNNLMGRELQLAYGREKDERVHPQLVLLMPLMEGTDGKVKMSKSYPEHCINLTDDPNDMFGKIMSIPDELLQRYELLLGVLNETQLAEQKAHIDTGAINPRDIKVYLAKYIVGQYHNQDLAEAAEQNFINMFQKKQAPDDMPELTLSAGTDHDLIQLAVDNDMSPSKKETRRILQSGGLKLDGEKQQPAESDPVINRNAGEAVVLQVGKRKFLKLNFE